MLGRRIRLLVSAISLLGARLALACPLCADNLSKDVYGNKPTDLGRGFFWSIILMVSMEFTLVSFVALKVYLSTRRTKAAAAARSLAESTAGTV